MIGKLVTFVRWLILPAPVLVADRRASNPCLAKFLDDNPDLECPECRGEGHHEIGCSLAY